MMKPVFHTHYYSLAMSQETLIQKIFQTIEALSGLEKKGTIPWDARVLVGYKVFRAFDKYRFALVPADIAGCLRELEDSLELLKKIITSASYSHRTKTLKSGEPQDKARRMQYLYGLAWAQQSDYEYYHGASHFADRLINSDFDISFLKGAKCLDMGTGHARYALAMVQLGAKSVTGFDFSKDCLLEARRRLAHYPKEEAKITLMHKSIYALPKSMHNAFDFVCANGFIHHLPDPETAFKIMYQTVKPGGRAFTFVFAEDGTPWWRAVDCMRNLLKPVPIWYSHKTLQGYEVPGNKIFNYLDYSYTPIQFRLKRDWVETTLKNIGFKELHFLEGGIIHDSVLRSRLFDADKALYGDSEIRYLLKK